MMRGVGSWFAFAQGSSSARSPARLSSAGRSNLLQRGHKEEPAPPALHHAVDVVGLAVPKPDVLQWGR